MVKRSSTTATRQSLPSEFRANELEFDSAHCESDAGFDKSKLQNGDMEPPRTFNYGWDIIR